jgi:hypothetical protein
VTRFACPACKAVLVSPEQDARATIACPYCKQRVIVPDPARSAGPAVLGELLPDDRIQPPPPTVLEARPAPHRPARSVRRPQSNTTLWIVLGVAAAFVVLLGLGCGGIALWTFARLAADAPAARARADAFLDELKADRVEAAYASTSRGFQANVSLEQFRGMTRAFPALTTHTSRTVQAIRVYSGTGGRQATFRAGLQSPTGALSCTLTLITEDGEWKVHHLSVP